MYLILVGPPGTGKGTQAKRLAERLGLAHVASGDMFREAAQRGTPRGLEAKAYMDRGELVPDELTITMLNERIDEPDAQAGVVFDGYPRTLGQAKALTDVLKARGKDIGLALNLTASDEELVRRLARRWLCGTCGEIYQEETRPPREPGVCDACSNRLSQREDDRPDVVRERLRRQRPTPELLDYYRSEGKLVDVDGERPVDEVTSKLLQLIEQRVGQLPV